MTETDLTHRLHELAGRVAPVDLRARVAEAGRRRRRRHQVATAAITVGLLVVAVVTVAAIDQPRRAAVPAGPTTVRLADATRGGVPSPALVVVDPGTRERWLVGADGSVGRLATRPATFTGVLPVWSADGSVLAESGRGQVWLVRSADGSTTTVRAPTDQAFLAAPSPDGSRLALAKDNQVDAIELTLLRRDGTDRTTMVVSRDQAAVASIPVLWSADGKRLLVLDGLGLTLVDLASGHPVPAATRAMPGDTLLGSGWAASPNLSRVVLSDPGTSGGVRRWVLVDVRKGAEIGSFARPAGDRLVGWTPAGRLAWWQRTADGYRLLTTGERGHHQKVRLRVVAPGRSLQAAWTPGRLPSPTGR